MSAVHVHYAWYQLYVRERASQHLMPPAAAGTCVCVCACLCVLSHVRFPVPCPRRDTVVVVPVVASVVCHSKRV